MAAAAASARQNINRRRRSHGVSDGGGVGWRRRCGIWSARGENAGVAWRKSGVGGVGGGNAAMRRIKLGVIFGSGNIAKGNLAASGWSA